MPSVLKHKMTSRSESKALVTYLALNKETRGVGLLRKIAFGNLINFQTTQLKDRNTTLHRIFKYMCIFKCL